MVDSRLLDARGPRGWTGRRGSSARGRGAHAGARAALERFWTRVSDKGAMGPVQRKLFDSFFRPAAAP